MFRTELACTATAKIVQGKLRQTFAELDGY